MEGMVAERVRVNKDEGYAGSTEGGDKEGTLKERWK